MVAPKFRTNLSSSQPQRTKTAAVMSSWCASARTTRRSSEKISRSARMRASTPSTTRGLAARRASSTCWRSAPCSAAHVRGALDAAACSAAAAIASPSGAASFVASRRESISSSGISLPRIISHAFSAKATRLLKTMPSHPRPKLVPGTRQQPTKYGGKKVIHSASQMWK